MKMELYEMMIIGQLVVNVIFILVIILMKVRINMLSREVKELKWNVEFSNSDVDLLADAIRGLGGIKF
ncbi:conserved hypothetical protein [Methanolacinia petrolearia DSM 11571]|jgi:hypothetical protein|uniref:Uncharacterized protein n=1 Tax=Methanolacinia petrolearia (strain DSM 11571 / OCM 486 / SEBR 4847) TaxID=679926 RepID=E1RGT6_METP4|nr:MULTISPECIES: hypothetical protein [Methanolacinia]ADN37465.1 conserved hypothetical protein [Methanolacinia petrolearia DSM 11571]